MRFLLSLIIGAVVIFASGLYVSVRDAIRHFGSSNIGSTDSRPYGWEERRD